MTNTLFTYFPDLNKSFSKKTEQKQWDLFLSFFEELIYVANDRRHKHVNGNGFVLHTNFLKTRLGNTARLKYDLFEELKPYVYSDGEYFFGKNGVAKEWLMTDIFKTQSKRFILDSKIKTVQIEKAEGEVIVSSKAKLTITESAMNHNEIKWQAEQDMHNALSDYAIIGENMNFLNGQDLIEYKEMSNGRLYHPLQQVSKVARATMFKRWYDYDIVAASPTILSQLARRIDASLALPNLDKYLANREAVRKSIAADVGISYKEVKAILTGLFFGMTVPSHGQLKFDAIQHEETEDYLFSLTKVLGQEKAYAILKNNDFDGLVFETKKIFKIIAESYKPAARIDGMWVVTNAAGKDLEISRWTPGRVVAHIYFGLERAITDVVASTLADKPLLLIHDGFICNERINKSSLEKKISALTGFNVELEENVL